MIRTEGPVVIAPAKKPEQEQEQEHDGAPLVFLMMLVLTGFALVIGA